MARVANSDHILFNACAFIYMWRFIPAHVLYKGYFYNIEVWSVLGLTPFRTLLTFFAFFSILLGITMILFKKRKTFHTAVKNDSGIKRALFLPSRSSYKKAVVNHDCMWKKGYCSSTMLITGGSSMRSEPWPLKCGQSHFSSFLYKINGCTEMKLQRDRGVLFLVRRADLWFHILTG